MKMKKIIAKPVLLLILLIQFPMNGQELNILQKPVQFLQSVEAGMIKFSPDGKYIAVTNLGNKGIALYQPDGKFIRNITKSEGAGWGFQWSRHENHIAARENYWNGPDKMSAIVIYQINGKKIFSSPLSPEYSLPFWSTTGRVLTFSEQQDQWKTIRLTPTNSGEPIIFFDGTDLLQTGSPLGCPVAVNTSFNGEILNMEYSPDNSKIVVSVAGRGLIVYDCAGNTVYDLGPGESPCWLNNEILLYMLVKDDGEKIINSDIYVKNFTGSWEKNLTSNFKEPVFYPTASPDGTVAFTTQDGKAYKMQIQIR